ncbi:NAD(P)-dependent oxidoreductase [Gammaproteobacteria bacterium]|jgi:nucleoside-diphosphate-sugar epimerase|nr:NAD(P)-dependent oxidoreductase [Gammaproteobacteria bacterium]
MNTLTRSNEVIVTGATGFIGQNLVPLLLSNKYQVTVVTRDSSKVQQFRWSAKVRIVEFDIHSGNIDVNVEPGTGLIHLAWQGLPDYNAAFHFEENLPHNYKFIKSLVLSGVNQVLITGTCAEFGSQTGSIESTTTPQPENSYAFAKDSLRKQLEFFGKDYQFCLQWARLYYMYGSGQNPQSLLPQLDVAIDNNEEIFNMSGGEQLRDYLPIEEVVKQLFNLYKKNQNGVFNVCSGNPISVRSLVENRIKERNSSIKPNFGYYPYTDSEPMSFWGIPDNQKE